MNVRLNRAKATLGDYELPDIIVRDAPKSYFTKYKQTMGDDQVKYTMESSTDRYSENIKVVPSGQNNMVKVSFSNAGGNGARTTSFPYREAQNPMKLGIVRPPMMDLDALRPRPRRATTSQTTNPTMKSGLHQHNPLENFDNKQFNKTIQNKVLTSSRPTASTRIDNNDRAIYDKKSIKLKELHSVRTGVRNINYKSDRVLLDAHAIKNFVNNVSKTTNPSFFVNKQQQQIDQNLTQKAIRENPILNSVNSNMKIIIYDANTHDSKEIQASVNDKLNIAIQSAASLPINLKTENGEHFKLKNYKANVVQTNPGNSILQITTIQPGDLILNRNVPIHFVNSAIRGDQVDLEQSSHNIDLENNIPLTSVTANTSLPGQSLKNSQQKDLQRKIDLYNIQSNVSQKDSKLKNSERQIKDTKQNLASVRTNTNIKNIGVDRYNTNMQPMKDKIITEKQYTSFENQGYKPQFERATKSSFFLPEKQKLENLFDRYT